MFGGKITTYRKLAEHALDKLAPFFPQLGPGLDRDRAAARRRHAGRRLRALARRLPARASLAAGRLARHYARLYGTRADALLDGARGLADLGRHFGGLLYEREARYPARATNGRETAEDILERRTKHGLHLRDDEKRSLHLWLQHARPTVDACALHSPCDV